MDAATVISLVVSVASFLAAAYVGIKQYTIQRNSNNLPVTFEILAQFQRPELLDAFDFIAEKLDNYDPDKGLAGLPPEDKAKVLDVCYFLQHVAMLILQDVIDERAFTAYFRARTIAVWEKTEPFIRKERALNQATGPEFLTLFEAFAAKARRFTPEVSQQILAEWLAKDYRGWIGANTAEKITGRRKIREKAYSEAMGRVLLSQPRADQAEPTADQNNPTDGRQGRLDRSDAANGTQEGALPATIEAGSSLSGIARIRFIRQLSIPAPAIRPVPGNNVLRETENCGSRAIHSHRQRATRPRSPNLSCDTESIATASAAVSSAMSMGPPAEGYCHGDGTTPVAS